MLHIGLDIHERTSSICILNATGTIVRRATVGGHPRKVLAELRAIGQPFAVCFEASTNYGWLHDELQRIASRVVVAHPGQLRLIFRSKRKNDRVDAERLAKLLYLGEVPTVYVPSVDTRAWRNMIEYRRRCVSERTRTKNVLRALLRMHGIESVRGRALWTKTGRTWLAAQEFPSTMTAMQRDQLLDDLAHQDTKIARVEKVLARIAQQHRVIELLQTIPGVGIRTAEAFLAYVDRADRFSTKAIGAYLGLVPSQDSSASVNRLGRITKDGPSSVRAYLTEASWQAIRRSATVRSFYERVRKERPDRTRKAIVATAHYLARVMLSMLKTGTVWQEANMA